jgi:hypothetical protein
LPAVLVGGAQDTLTASFSMPGGTKYVKLLQLELVPTSTFNEGFVFIRSTNNVPLYGLQLFFTRDLQVISNVAAGTIDSSITFAPPAPPVPLPPLTITSISPGTASLGNNVTITGTGFNPVAGSNTVVFTSASGTVSATPSTATATSMTVTVPGTAITGPVFMTTGGRFSSSAILTVTANATTTITSSVNVSASQNTIADIYVTGPAGNPGLNAIALAQTASDATSASLGARTVEVIRGQTRRLWVQGDGINSANGTTVTISGPGIAVKHDQYIDGNDVVLVQITIDANATVGARNVVLRNNNLDTSVITGGLIIR